MTTTSGDLGVRVTDLFVYPVKSCAGIRVEAARVTAGGFEDDRRWMLTDEEGRFVTQRDLPELSGLRLSLGDDGATPTYRMEGPRGRSFEFPRRLAPEAGRELPVTVWSDRLVAYELPELSAWLRGTLTRPLRAVFLPEARLRQVNPKRARLGDRVGFADAYPFLLLSRESLRELNRRLSERGEPALDVRRFRPNLVVAGCASAHEEDTWSSLTIGSVAFRAAKLCDRCSITTVDPDSGRRGKEPLRTLAEYRRWDGKVWFAVNLLHEPQHVGNAIALGDEVRVHARGGPGQGTPPPSRRSLTPPSSPQR